LFLWLENVVAGLLLEKLLMELVTLFDLWLETMLELVNLLVGCLLVNFRPPLGGTRLTPGGRTISTWEHQRLWSGSWEGSLKCIILHSSSQVSEHSSHDTVVHFVTGFVLQTGTAFSTQEVASFSHWLSTLSNLLYQISVGLQSQ